MEASPHPPSTSSTSSSAAAGNAPSRPLFHVPPEDRAELLAQLPPEVEEECDPSVLARFENYWRITQSGMGRFTDALRGKKEFGNPYILEGVIAEFGLDQYATNYPPEGM